MKVNKNVVIVLILTLVAGIIIVNSLTQPGIKDLETDFVEISFSRNEQNTGPILRAYIVTADQYDESEMIIYGNFMPHTKYGNTRVYFFDLNKPFPASVNIEEPFFDKKYKENCLSVYEKNGMGEVTLKRFNLE